MWRCDQPSWLFPLVVLKESLPSPLLVYFTFQEEILKVHWIRTNLPSVVGGIELFHSWPGMRVWRKSKCRGEKVYLKESQRPGWNGAWRNKTAPLCLCVCVFRSCWGGEVTSRQEAGSSLFFLPGESPKGRDEEEEEKEGERREEDGGAEDKPR